jgi:hypothetical protein
MDNHDPPTPTPPPSFVHYILDGKTPVPCKDLVTWMQWMQNTTANRRVAETYVGPYRISTVFIGVTLIQADAKGFPLLFETQVFNDDDKENAGSELYRTRCSTWTDAEAMHYKGCDIFRKKLSSSAH